MSKILTPEEFHKKQHPHADDILDSSNAWYTSSFVKDYAEYVVSQQPKPDIILPEYKEIEDTWDHKSFAWNAAIDEVKRLNGIQE